MTNTPVSFGRDAQQFVKTSKLLVDNAKPIAFFKVLFEPERFRILKQLFSGLKTPSVAVECYWSRTPFQDQRPRRRQPEVEKSKRTG